MLTLAPTVGWVDGMDHLIRCFNALAIDDSNAREKMASPDHLVTSLFGQIYSRELLVLEKDKLSYQACDQENDK